MCAANIPPSAAFVRMYDHRRLSALVRPRIVRTCPSTQLAVCAAVVAPPHELEDVYSIYAT